MVADQEEDCKELHSFDLLLIEASNPHSNLDTSNIVLDQIYFCEYCSFTCKKSHIKFIIRSVNHSRKKKEKRMPSAIWLWSNYRLIELIKLKRRWQIKRFIHDRIRSRGIALVKFIVRMDWYGQNHRVNIDLIFELSQ